MIVKDMGIRIQDFHAERRGKEVPGMTTELWDYWTNSLEWSRGMKVSRRSGAGDYCFHSKVVPSIDLKMFVFSFLFLSFFLFFFFALIKSKVKLIMFQKKVLCTIRQICKHSALDIEEVEIRSASKAVFVGGRSMAETIGVWPSSHTPLCV